MVNTIIYNLTKSTWLFIQLTRDQCWSRKSVCLSVWCLTTWRSICPLIFLKLVDCIGVDEDFIHFLGTIRHLNSLTQAGDFAQRYYYYDNITKQNHFDIFFSSDHVNKKQSIKFTNQCWRRFYFLSTTWSPAGYRRTGILENCARDWKTT